MNDKVVTRFAPSPTGNLHCGAYRTAIFSYLYARKNKGEFILRIEDTDKERSKKEYEDNILESLKWLGLEHDHFYRQSEHVNRHKEVLSAMIEKGHAYISREEAKDGSGVIKEIVRFKNPNIDVSFHDEIKGTIIMNTEDLGDFVIAKNINEPLFHLAVVIDDFDEGVTHVIRGEDHVSNTPRQILIQRAIGAPTPTYAHLPLVLGTDKQKLSKRKGALAVTEYRDLGYLPQAILNMVAMVGWNPGTEQEIFSKDDLIKEFELSKVQKAGAVFNTDKLDWFNREYIKMMDQSAFWTIGEKYVPQWVYDIDTKYEMLAKIEHIIRDRIDKFADMKILFEAGEFDYFFKEPNVAPESLVWKTDSLENAKTHLAKASEILEKIDDWTMERIKSAIMLYAEEVALSGRDKSPDPFEISSIIGKEKTLNRIKACL
jgi:glutamyl-tRNA synthetase